MDLPPLIHRGPYLARKINDHPLASDQGYVMEHRRVAWEEWGPFDPALQVHHVNGAKHDNRIENLELLTLEDHAAHHAHEARRHDYDAVAADYEAGLSAPEVGKKHGINSGNVWRILKRQGVETRAVSDYGFKPRGPSPLIGTTQPRAVVEAKQHPFTKEIIEGYQNGESVKEMAERFGIGTTSIPRIIERAGLPRRPAGRPRRRLAE